MGNEGRKKTRKQKEKKVPTVGSIFSQGSGPWVLRVLGERLADTKCQRGALLWKQRIKSLEIVQRGQLSLKIGRERIDGRGNRRRGEKENEKKPQCRVFVVGPEAHTRHT